MNRFAVLPLIILASACSSGVIKQQNMASDQKVIINSNSSGTGTEISVEFFKGKSFYYPLMAVWIEDEAGNYIQTLYVPRSVATGVFKYGKKEINSWVPASKRAPQALPYWAHKRAVKASDGLFMPDEVNPVADAYSGATPSQSFVLNTRADSKLPGVFRLMFEINQNWDWNWYWTNDKYPDDENYKMSCQPALVYEAVIDQNKSSKVFRMKAIGHSHYSGKTGELFTDLSTLTTALAIADSITVRIK
jgi:hypothetical protein